MNPRDEDYLLDLLVDGELDEPRRRKLLQELDQRPEGWRRCALAFLEAQTWRQAAGAYKRDTAASPPPTPQPTIERKPAPRRGGPGWYRPLGNFLAMAATFVVALTLGLWLRGEFSDGGTFNLPVAHHSGSSAVITDPTSPASPGTPAWQNLTLVVDGPAGNGSQIELPVVDAAQPGADLVRQWPSPLGRELQQMLEQQGHRVMQRRDWLPMQTDDGRRVVVPVDELQITPVRWQ